MKYFLLLFLFSCGQTHSRPQSVVYPGTDGTTNELLWEVNGQIFWGDCATRVPSQENCTVTSTFSSKDFDGSFSTALSAREGELKAAVAAEIARLKSIHPIVLSLASKRDAADLDLKAAQSELARLVTLGEGLTKQLPQATKDIPKLKEEIAEYNRQLEGVNEALRTSPNDADLKKLKTSLEGERQTRLEAIEAANEAAEKIQVQIDANETAKKAADLKVKELQQVATKAMADFKKGYDELQVNSDELKALGAKIKKLENYNRVFLLLRAKIGNGGLYYRLKDLEESERALFLQLAKLRNVVGNFNGNVYKCSGGSWTNNDAPAEAKYYALESCDSGEGSVLSVRTFSTNNTGSSTTCGGYGRTQYYNVYEISYQCTPKWDFEN